MNMLELAEALRRREGRIFRLPEPERPEDESDLQERHSHTGGDLSRMAARMQGAMRKLGLSDGSALLLSPSHTLEQFVLWLAAVAGGHDMLQAAAPAEGERLVRERAAANGVGAIVCPPAEKDRWRPLAEETGTKLATLGGHWQGSFFMLQMVRPETEMTRTERPGETVFAGGEGRALAALLAAAETLAGRAGLREAPAMVLSAPVLAAPRYLAAALAALITDAPLHWLAPAERERALREWPDLPKGAVLLADAPFLAALTTRRKGAILREGMRSVDIDGLTEGS